MATGVFRSRQIMSSPFLAGLGLAYPARFMSKNGEGDDESFSKCKLSKSSADADRNPVLFGIVGTPYVRERVF